MKSTPRRFCGPRTLQILRFDPLLAMGASCLAEGRSVHLAIEALEERLALSGQPGGR